MRAYGERLGDAFNDGDLVRWRGGYVDHPCICIRRMLKRRARREGVAVVAVEIDARAAEKHVARSPRRA